MFSFNDLENGILRDNRKAPYRFQAQFSKDDPRQDLRIKPVDPRIHFSLNCGATSCPAISQFTKEAFWEELGVVTQGFCEDDNNVYID